MTRFLVLALAVALVAAPSVAFAAPTADEKRRAGEYYVEGDNLFKKELYAAAIENFKKSFELVEVPATLYNIARSYEKLGDSESCVDWYGKYVDLHKKQNGGKEPPDIVDVRASIQKCQLGMRPKIRVESEPFGAKVYIDDKTKLLGQTPYETTLDPGSYTLYLDITGFKPFKEQFEVRAGEPIKLFFKLEKFQRTGTVNVTSNIRGATIFLDGKNVGLTPYNESIVLDEGQHQITVDKDEYRPYNRELEVVVNESYAVHSELFLRNPPMTWKGYVGWTSLVLGVGAGVGGFFAGQHADTFFSDTDDFKQFETLQFVGYGVGGGLIGVGIGLLIWEAVDDKIIDSDDAIESAGTPRVTPLISGNADGAYVGADIRF